MKQQKNKKKSKRLKNRRVFKKTEVVAVIDEPVFEKDTKGVSIFFKF